MPGPPIVGLIPVYFDDIDDLDDYDDYDDHGVYDYDDDNEKLYQALVLLFPPTPSPLSSLEAFALKPIMMMKVAMTMTEVRINIITITTTTDTIIVPSFPEITNSKQ